MASPTGTGKTLTGFLVAIDAAYRAHDAGAEGPGLPEVVYVSPLRALAADVHENLQVPLAGIRAAAAELGLSSPSSRSPCAPATPRRPSGRPCGAGPPTCSSPPPSPSTCC